MKLTPWMQEVWDQYQAGLLEAHRQGLSELLGSKNAVQEMTLETGQKLLIAYDQDLLDEKKTLEKSEDTE